MAPKKEFTYAALTVEMQSQLIAERLTRLEAEHYGHALNIRLSEQHLDGPLAENAKTQINQAQMQMAIIEQAIETVKAELSKIGA